ncbi:Thymidine kinase [Phytophthora citrophthora]|uniref:thymidine kinase n=1 Tax=Phytophthora citrophthora TaxID=4793 RepID=A0AAD9GPN2_9STRA|nr:Thymidine kinase [Phytophthora citrophthora]
MHNIMPLKWELDGVDGGFSSMELLLQWLAIPRNMERWVNSKKTMDGSRAELITEIVDIFKSRGIKRSRSGIIGKLWTFEHQVGEAYQWLKQRGMDPFDISEEMEQKVATIYVLVQWLLDDGNAGKWFEAGLKRNGSRKQLNREICFLLLKCGITYRTCASIETKIMNLMRRWDRDAVDGRVSSLDVLLEWLAIPGNTWRWYKATKARDNSQLKLCDEVCELLLSRGINRTIRSIKWDTDGINGSPSSLDLILRWLAAPGNAARWLQSTRTLGERMRISKEIHKLFLGHGIEHRTRKSIYRNAGRWHEAVRKADGSRWELAVEIYDLLLIHGIPYRSRESVEAKLRLLEEQFDKAENWLIKKGFDHYQDSAAVESLVVQLCPAYATIEPALRNSQFPGHRPDANMKIDIRFKPATQTRPVPSLSGSKRVRNERPLQPEVDIRNSKRVLVLEANREERQEFFKLELQVKRDEALLVRARARKELLDMGLPDNESGLEDHNYLGFHPLKTDHKLQSVLERGSSFATIMARNNKAANKRRATQTWDRDPARPGAISPLEVLMMWLTVPGNAERWRRQNRKELLNEIVQNLHTQGIHDREPSDVQYKIRIMEHSFGSATAYLSQNKLVDAFQRGETDHKTNVQVAKLCPQYRQLLQVFGKPPKNSQVDTNGAANGATGSDKNNETGSAAGSKNAAGEWKKGLEENGRAIAETKQTNGGEKKEIVAGKANAKQPNGAKTDEKGATGIAGTLTNLPEQSVVDATANVIVDVAIGAAQANVKDEETGKDQAVSEDVADEDHSDDDAGKQSGAVIQEEKEAETAQASSSSESEDENSEEEEKPRTRVAVKTGVRSPFKTKPKESESEDSSSSEEDKNEDKDESDSESEQEETDEEDRIPLAQADEVEPTPTGDEEEQSVDDAETAKAEESSSSEEEAELEEEPRAKLECELQAKQVQLAMERSLARKKLLVPSPATTSPAAPKASLAASDTSQAAPKSTVTKRKSSAEELLLVKRARTEEEVAANTKEVMEIERKALLKRVDDEEQQRHEMHELERAKLKCELESKQIQLLFEKAAARKKLDQLGLIIGPMFSGKSTELIRRIHRYQHAKLECLVVKYLFDTRHSEEYVDCCATGESVLDCVMLSTHDKVFVEAMPVQALSEVRPFLDDCDVIGIDEGQFYPDLVEFCQEAANMGKVVVVAALDATFERKAFENVVELIPTAEKVVKLNAICSSCGQDAAFTRRLVADTTLELIGGSEIRRNLSYREKLAIIEKKESEPSWTQCNLALWAKEAFRLESKPTQATISNLLRDKHKLLNAAVPLEYRSARRVKHPELDQEMLKWVHQELQSGQSVTRTAIQNKAVELAQELQLPSDVSFSRGWVTSFMNRHQLNTSKKNGVVVGQDISRMQEQAQLVQTQESQVQVQENQVQTQEEDVEEADNSLEVEEEPAEVDQDSREQFSTVEVEDQSRKRKREDAWQSREEGRATGESLLDWIAVPGSYSRWWLLKTDEEKEPLCDEINLFLRSHGLRGMNSFDIRQQMTTFVTTFQAAHTWLNQSKVEYPMNVTDMTLEQKGIKNHVLQMCPHYEKLVLVLAAYVNYDNSSTSTEAQAATIETTPPLNGSSTPVVQAPDTPVAVESPPKRKESEPESTESTTTDTAEDETKAQKRRLFELECARLQSEIETRNVQLVLEKTLARKKLQDAGISPEEVDRIFPL